MCGQDMSADFLGPPSTGSLAEDLASLAEYAASQGHPLEEIVLIGCTFTSSAIDELDKGRKHCRIEIVDPRIIVSSIAW